MALAKDGKVRVLLKTTVKEITADSATIVFEDKEETIRNDFVIVSAGGILPTTFLQGMGINVETKWGSE
jgi:thioredoxin reductase (NADPH)